MMPKEKIVEENLGLVHACAKRFKGRGVEYDDLFQAGCVGLIKAVNGFDESLGYEFSTYAVPAVLGEIKRLFRDGGIVKVSRSLKERSRQLLTEKELLSDKMGREPTVNELSAATGLSVFEVSELLLCTQSVLSLTQNDDENEEKQLNIPVDSHEEQVLTKIDLRRCFGELSPLDRQIINLRYFSLKTQTEVGKALNMSQVQVSRREKKILKEIREKMTV